jgi:hypothetical protein
LAINLKSIKEDIQACSPTKDDYIFEITIQELARVEHFKSSAAFVT